MKAIQIHAYNEPYKVHNDIPIPSPKPHQVLVHIKAAGFCHTDLMALNGEFGTKLPFIGSHEPAGVVVDVGKDVEGFGKGDRVGCINFDSVCGKCPDCKAGLPIYCDNPLMKGITTDGAWAEYMVADARFMVKIPDDMDFKIAAPLMCAGISIYGGIVRAEVPKGGSIGIVGVGGLGHIGTQVAKCMVCLPPLSLLYPMLRALSNVSDRGYKVAAIDAKKPALHSVASYTHKPDALILSSDPVEISLSEINKVTTNEYGYPGLDATVLATDHPAAFEMAAALTRKHGTMVLLGQPEKGIAMSYLTTIYKDIKLVGSLVADTKQAEELVKLVHKNGLHVDVKEWKMGEAEEMRQAYLKGTTSGKNVIVID